MQKRRRNLKRPAALFLSMAVAASLFAGTAATAFADDTTESAASVRVVVINNLDTSVSSSLQGTIVDEWVEVDSDSTALSAVTTVLEDSGYTLGSYDSSYGTYLSSVSVTGSTEDADTLGETYTYYTEDDVNYMNGTYWSIWLNGQYCSNGIDYYTIADATLADGDTFILDLTDYTYNTDTWESVGESLSGLVRIVVQNTSDTSAALTGTLTDSWVEVTSSSTALSALTDALAQDGYTLESYETSYGTYLSGITSDAASLAGYDDASVDGNTTYYTGAYWAIYLNDTYCENGIDYYTVADSTLAAGDNFTMSYEAYSYTEDNSGSTTGTSLAKQTIKVKASSLKKTYKASKLKKSKKTFKIKATAKTKVTFAKKNKKYIKVAKNGTVTVKKGTPVGTYKVKVKITAAKSAKYKKATVTKTITVKVK